MKTEFSMKKTVLKIKTKIGINKEKELETKNTINNSEEEYKENEYNEN